mmetsp:Transcript_16841/g.28655  ORF Transcript_16841/g.28655 Transcript_16841/m.28655 type:complete len:134 (+) Transcript_16841:24-425(+)
MMVYLTVQNWLLFVSGLSLFGSLQAFISPDTLKERQFSNKPDQVTPLARRLFGAWTIVATCVRFACGMYPEPTLYLVTFSTFIVVTFVYGSETFVHRTIPLKNALAPFFIASVSLGWMYYEMPNFVPQAVGFI